MAGAHADLEVVDDHSCGLHEDGTIRCWGRSTYNEALVSHAAMP